MKKAVLRINWAQPKRSLANRFFTSSMTYYVLAAIILLGLIYYGVPALAG